MGAVAGARTGVTNGPGAGVTAPLTSVTPGCNKPLPVKQYHSRAGKQHSVRLALFTTAAMCT